MQHILILILSAAAGRVKHTWEKKIKTRHKNIIQISQSINIYLYSPCSQIPICILGLNKVQHPLFSTLNKSSENAQQVECLSYRMISV